MGLNDEKNLHFETPLSLRDLVGEGQTFTIDTGDMKDLEANPDFELDFLNFPDVENYTNPIEQTFDDHKMHMTEVFDGVWKKVLKEAPADAKPIDFSRHRVTYHRNFFMENEPAPFDSTYLNGKPDVICNDVDEKLTGFTEALSTMKEGENSLFIITYQKMFGANGCMPRVQPSADILAELKVLKVEEIGDDKSVKKLNDFAQVKTFDEAKELTKEARLRAKDYFDNGNISEAVRMYQKIIQMLHLVKVETAYEDEKNTLFVQIMSNLATCYNIQNKPKKTLSSIQQIESKCSIENQPKLLFTKGKALRMLGEFDEAVITLKKAQLIRPNDHAISKELDKLDKCIADYNDLSKKLSSKLFIN